VTDTAKAIEGLPAVRPDEGQIRKAATGTCDGSPDDARQENARRDLQSQPQQSGRFSQRNGAKRRDDAKPSGNRGGSRKPLQTRKKCDSVRPHASACERPAGVAQLVEHQPSKLDTLSVTPENTTTYDGDDATPTHNPDSCDENGPQDADLWAVVDAWPTLPEAVRLGITAMVRASGNAGRGESGME